MPSSASSSLMAVPEVGVLGLQLQHAAADAVELLAGREAVGRGPGVAGRDLLHQARDAHLEELVEVAGEDATGSAPAPAAGCASSSAWYRTRSLKSSQDSSRVMNGKPGCALPGGAGPWGVRCQGSCVTPSDAIRTPLAFDSRASTGPRFLGRFAQDASGPQSCGVGRGAFGSGSRAGRPAVGAGRRVLRTGAVAAQVLEGVEAAAVAVGPGTAGCA